MAKASKISSPQKSRVWRDALPALALFLLTLIAYCPALRGEFNWDDDVNIIKSLPLRSLDGLRRIWFELGATQQYYPLTHTSFWLDYHLWGLHPWAYHLENVLLHALSAVLLWRLLKRLGARGAWFAASLFALHPVCVESVAWITERKNTLSGVFFLASLLAAIEFWLPKKMNETPASNTTRSQQNQPRAGAEAGGLAARHAGFDEMRFYWLALFLYVCALWSKTATIGLPGIILLLIWWKRRFFVRRDFALLLPFLVCGVGMALVTMSIETHLRLQGGPDDWQFSPLERWLIASRAVWFYLGKIVWPHPLMFMYPRWNIQVGTVLDYVPVAGIVATFAFLWSKRNDWARPVLVGLGSFVVILFPVLGAFNVFFYRYSFVCDHFQYLALIGPIALLAAAMTKAVDIFSKGQPLLKPAICGILLTTLGMLTWRQSGIYQNRETLWRDTLVHNPNSWMAHDNLGILLSQAGRFDEADYQYQTAIELRPNDYVAYFDLGLECAMKGELDRAILYYSKSLDLSSSYTLTHYELANVLARQGRLDDALREYKTFLGTNPDHALAHFNLANALAKKGELEDAMQEYTKALQLDPEFALAAFNIGNVLAKKGNLDGAIEQYDIALEIQPTNSLIHSSLGRTLAAKGNVDQAIAQYQKALELDPNSVEAMANLGNALVGQMKFDEAVGYYRSALRLNPGSAVIHYNLAAALSRQGKTDEAQAELSQAKQLQQPVLK